MTWLSFQNRRRITVDAESFVTYATAEDYSADCLGIAEAVGITLRQELEAAETELIYFRPRWNANPETVHMDRSVVERCRNGNSPFLVKHETADLDCDGK